MSSSFRRHVRTQVTLIVLAGFLPALGWPTLAVAQSDSLDSKAVFQEVSDTTFHVSLRRWAESAWLLILDQNNSQGGMQSDRGLLRRFNENVDDKYHLDLATAEFPMSFDHEWYSRDSGVRWQTGSINKRDLVMEAEFKTRVSLGNRWDFEIEFNKTETPEAHRSIVRIGGHRRLSNSLSVFSRLHLDNEKPGSDFELGFDWSGRTGVKVNASVSVLDFANDLIYLNFDAVSQTLADSTIEYRRQPIIGRSAISVPFSSTLRVEAYGAYLRPSTFLAYDGRDETAGFSQHQNFSFAGGLFEWAPSGHVRVGGFATNLWAHTARTRLSPTTPVVPYTLSERTTFAGLFFENRLSSHWTLNSSARRIFRKEKRSESGTKTVDLNLRSWNALVDMRYRATRGFTANFGLGWNHTRGHPDEGQIPAIGSLDTNIFRFRYEAGWSSSKMQFLVGMATDLDGDEFEPSFGGARGRLAVFW